MIAFDMECSQGHVFEGWFDSLESFEEQNAKKLVKCPYCDDTNIRKIISPVSVKRAHSVHRTGHADIDYQRLAKEVIDHIHKNSEDVGTKFTSEALKMHYGVTEKRNIMGSATSDEEETLKEEGVQFFKLPLPKIKDDKKH